MTDEVLVGITMPSGCFLPLDAVQLFDAVLRFCGDLLEDKKNHQGVERITEGLITLISTRKSLTFEDIAAHLKKCGVEVEKIITAPTTSTIN